jgi:hypothetical protein
MSPTIIKGIAMETKKAYLEAVAIKKKFENVKRKSDLMVKKFLNKNEEIKAKGGIVKCKQQD